MAGDSRMPAPEEPRICWQPPVHPGDRSDAGLADEPSGCTGHGPRHRL